MTDSMKFGPEWLRNLSADGSSTTTSTTRYHLAEHRYGREEMLALFEQSLKIRPPASMTSFTSLYVDQALNPLALAPVTEDENRLWSGRAVVGGGTRGRGGSLERGRGRGRGGTFHPGFSRSTSSYDEPLRSYDRSQSDRGWPERNGDITGDWGGSSPRKEYGSSRSGTAMQDNWRRHRDNSADDDGWRSSSQHTNRDKWSGPGSGSGSRSTGNWRSESERTVDERETARGSGWYGPADHGRAQPHRRPWDAEDHLPEWANEIPSESGGSFDASGAFHGSDDEVNDKRTRTREQPPLHKSASQHNITSSPKKPPPLATSQSAVNLAKPTPSVTPEELTNDQLRKGATPPVNDNICQMMKPPTPPPIHPEPEPEKEKPPEKGKEAENSQHQIEARTIEQMEQKKNLNARPVDDEFDHMKEVTDDLVAKLILDDDTLPKRSDVGYGGLSLGGTALPPPGTAAGDKWFYRDPQGETQGPFSAQEMTEWYRAGYFTVGLLVRRQCDERYFMLGELVKQCPGGVPFQTCRLAPLKNEPAIPLPKPSEQDAILQHQLHVQRFLQRQAETIRALSQTEPWSQLSNLQQRELVSQHMLQQSNILPDVPYVPQIQNAQLSNPIMHMINQMQQASKLPAQPSLVEKPPNSVPSNQLDPIQQLVQQMGGLPPNITPVAPTMPTIDQASTADVSGPIKNLLRQLSTKAPTIESMWPTAAAATYQTPLAPQPQPWPTQTLPASLWDLHAVPQPAVPQPPPQTQAEPIAQTSAAIQEHATLSAERVEKDIIKKAEAEQKEAKARERKEVAEKEKKKKELEQEKIKAQKEAEEKRKEEQRKKEAEKKAEVERQKREDERVRKELEKAKREAEEKRLRELEEKRRLKEQRKAEEEVRRKQEEEKQRQEEEAVRHKQEEERQRQKEEVGRRQQEALRKMQEQQRVSKVAPWASLPGTGGSSGGAPAAQPVSLSLAEIQRIEREKKAEQAALAAQQQRALAFAREALEQQQQQQQQERQLGWAVKKPTQPKKVKSLAEIQAEEQEKLQRQQAEQRLREQSTPAASVTASASAGIWGTASQNLTWASNQQQWQHASGFWDDSPIQKKATFAIKQQQQSQPQQQLQQQPPQQAHPSPAVKQAITIKTINASAITVAPGSKTKAKKEEQQVMKHFDKSTGNDEFSAWCTKTLATLNGDVDIPTFISFLRDIESPYEVKDYVRQYLGDSAQAAHFANQFVERRSKARDRQRAANQHKDDLNTPAPAVNPASSDFQEVKGKGKKSKKSKMVKLDNRALGFNVIAAQDRINVGDRDYGDNL